MQKISQATWRVEDCAWFLCLVPNMLEMKMELITGHQHMEVDFNSMEENLWMI